MSKAFTKESDQADDEDGLQLPALPVGGKNYITGRGYARLRAELVELMDTERPKVVEIVHWAASNGDRSENGDYIYGKKRLREVDRRIRFLIKRLDLSQVVDPAGREHADDADRVFFGATVTVSNERDEERTVSIVGIDEIDTTRGYISWVSPMARALLKAHEGDTVLLHTPVGDESLTVVRVAYQALATNPEAPAPAK